MSIGILLRNKNEALYFHDPLINKNALLLLQYGLSSGLLSYFSISKKLEHLASELLAPLSLYYYYKYPLKVLTNSKIDLQRIEDIYKDNYEKNIRIYKKLLDEIINLNTTIVGSHFFISVFIPAFLLISSFGSPYALPAVPAALYYMLGRGRLFRSLGKSMNKNMEFVDDISGLKFSIIEDDSFNKFSQLIEKKEWFEGKKLAWKAGNHLLYTFFRDMDMQNDVVRLRSSPFHTLSVIKKGGVIRKGQYDGSTFKSERLNGSTTYIKEANNKLFDTEPTREFLQTCFHDYKNLYNRIKEEIKKGFRTVEEIVIEETSEGNRSVFSIGARRPDYKVIVCTGHEDETAGELACAWLIKSLCQYNGKYTEYILERFKFYIMPVDDTIGYNKKSWTVVTENSEILRLPRNIIGGINGELRNSLVEEYKRILNLSEKKSKILPKQITPLHLEPAVIPFEYGGKIIRDENGVRGDDIQAEFIAREQAFFKRIMDEKTVVIDLHETNSDGADLFYGNEGILFILDSPTIERKYKMIEEIMRESPISMFFIRPKYDIERAEAILRDSKDFKLIKYMENYFRNEKVKLINPGLVKTVSILPQLLPISDATTIDGPLLRDGEIYVRTREAVRRGAMLGITTETFPQLTDFSRGIWERVRQQIYAVEALTLGIDEIYSKNGR
ncbi:MAG: hypothetical protein QXJ14_00520 [Candidatus Aenigmatarchaeota archaeon]